MVGEKTLSVAKNRRLPDLPDDNRCTRNGKNWRCHMPRLPNKSYCHKHTLLNQSRSKKFDKLKTQSITAQNDSSSNLREIWAFRQNPDGHPNFYARVDRIIPSKSQVEVTPLIPSDTVNNSSSVGCGLFRASDTSETREMSEVSHRVWFDMESEYLYKIYPRKGEVWAVDVYQWVEMVSSFGDEEGASGQVLVDDGPEGFRRKLHDGCELIRRFGMDEVRMFRFRVSGARVVGNGLGLLEKCTIIEQDQKSGSDKDESTDHISAISNYEVVVNADEIAMRTTDHISEISNHEGINDNEMVMTSTNSSEQLTL